MKNLFLIILFVATFFSACTDYVQQIEDRHGELDISDDVLSSSSGSTSSSTKGREFSSSAAKSSSDKVTEPAEVTVGFMTDARDGRTYKAVKIGTQTWMAQNLNYKVNCKKEKGWCYHDVLAKCYNEDTTNCAKYGRLYSWAVAMDSAGEWNTNGKGCGYGSTCSPTTPVRGVCPQGWHLPSQTEWNTLFTAVGGQSTAGKVLKSTSGWYNSGNGTDAFSFSALPAGLMSYDWDFRGEGYDAYFWSSTEDGSFSAFNMDLDYFNVEANLDNNKKNYVFSVRCLKD